VTAALAAALVPLGFKVLREGPAPERRVLLGWSAMAATVAIVFYLLSGLG
jgi:hypothetical protein